MAAAAVSALDREDFSALLPAACTHELLYLLRAQNHLFRFWISDSLCQQFTFATTTAAFRKTTLENDQTPPRISRTTARNPNLTIPNTQQHFGPLRLRTTSFEKFSD